MDQIPAHLQGNRRQLGAQSISGMGQAPVPYISIEGNVFTLVDASGATMQAPTYGPVFTQRDSTGAYQPVAGSPVGVYLDCVLVDTNEHISKTYYATAYQPGAQQFMPPDCWSDNGVAPSVGANKPQAALCSTCPFNEWGSKVNALGNKVKACSDIMKMAFIMPWLPQLSTAFLFRLQGSSHRNWRTYVEKLMRNSVGDRQLDPTDVVTRIYLLTEGGRTGIVDFACVDLINAHTAQLEDAIWKAHATDALVGRLDKPRQMALPAPGFAQVLPTDPAVHAAPQTAFAPPPVPPPMPPTFAPPVAPTFQPPPLQPTASPAAHPAFPGGRPGGFQPAGGASHAQPAFAAPEGFQAMPTAPQAPPQMGAPLVPGASPSNGPAPEPRTRRRRAAAAPGPGAGGPPAGAPPQQQSFAMPAPAAPAAAQPPAGFGVVGVHTQQAPPPAAPAAPSFGMQQPGQMTDALSAALQDALRPLPQQ